MNGEKPFADYYEDEDDEDTKDTEMDKKHKEPHTPIPEVEKPTRKRKLKCECGLPSCKTCKERTKKQRKRARIALQALRQLMPKEDDKEEKKEAKEDKKEAKEDKQAQALSEGDHKIKCWGEKGESNWTTASAIKKLDDKESKNSGWAWTVFSNETGTQMRERAKEAAKLGFFTAYQWEICPTTKKNHHQGFTWCDKPRWRSEIMQAVAGQPFFYCRKQYSCKTKALAYVSKETEKQLVSGEDNQWLEGDWDSVPESANKKKTELLRKRIRTGHIKTMKDVWTDDELGTMVLTAGSRVKLALELEKDMQLNERRKEKGLPEADLETTRDGEVEVKVFVGIPGAGKSVAAMEWLGATYDEKTDGYKGTDEHILQVAAGSRGKFNINKGQTEGIIEDFDGTEEFLPLTVLSKILGGNAYRFDEHAVAGSIGSSECKLTKIAITSNLPPKLWYTKAHPLNRGKLLRRLQHVKYFTKTHAKAKHIEPVYEIDGVQVDKDPADDFMKLMEGETRYIHGDTAGPNMPRAEKSSSNQQAQQPLHKPAAHAKPLSDAQALSLQANA